MTEQNIISAYPLQYPVGWKRTERKQYSRFKNNTIACSRNYILRELRLLGAKNVIINSNLQLKKDGLPYSNQRIEDVGVAIYFTYKGKQQCIPCDRWTKVENNLWAVYKCIEAIRGLERWGAKDFVDASFSGFKALPMPEQSKYPRFFDNCKDIEEAKETYRKLAKELHPDFNNGNSDAFMELKRQFDELGDLI